MPVITITHNDFTDFADLFDSDFSSGYPNDANITDIICRQCDAAAEHWRNLVLSGQNTRDELIKRTMRKPKCGSDLLRYARAYVTKFCINNNIPIPEWCTPEQFFPIDLIALPFQTIKYNVNIKNETGYRDDFDRNGFITGINEGTFR